jgi:hypothetical protein
MLHHLMTLQPLPGNNYNTIIVDALFPFGHHPEAYPEFVGHDALADISTLLVPYDESSVVPDSSVGSSVVAESSSAVLAGPSTTLSVIAGPSTTLLVVSDTSVASLVVQSCRLPSATRSRDDTQPDDTNSHSADSLHHIQLRYTKWQTALVHTRILMRITLCTGEYGNPFSLNHSTGDDLKSRFVAELFDQALQNVGLTREELGSGEYFVDLMCFANTDSFPVRLVDGDSEITEGDILAMVCFVHCFYLLVSRTIGH